jgi:hypothetical protein
MQEIGDLWRHDQQLHAKYILAEKKRLRLFQAIRSV